MKTVVITRTRPDADALAARIEAMGYRALTEPMLTVKATHAPTPHDPMCVEGLVVTSAQALRHLNTLVREVAFLHKPLYAVGPRTAQLARDRGWVNVHDGGGDVKALGDFLKSRKEIGPSSRLLHICGRDIAQDTRATLAAVPGIILDWIVYETEGASGFSQDFLEALRTGAIHAVLFYSTRAAAVFAQNVQTYIRDQSLNQIKLLCLAPSMIESLATLHSGGTYAASRPEEDAILALL